MQNLPTVITFEQKVLAELATLRQLIQQPEGLNISSNWIPRKDVMKFLSYGDTQRAALEKKGELIVTKVGKRKFFHRDSLNKLLEKNIQTP